MGPERVCAFVLAGNLTRHSGRKNFHQACLSVIFPWQIIGKHRHKKISKKEGTLKLRFHWQLGLTVILRRRESEGMWNQRRLARLFMI